MLKMLKKDKLYFLIFIFSVNSLIAAVILKLFNIDIFSIKSYNSDYPLIGFIVKLLILLILYILIVGCITCYPPKRLFFKMMPFLPLTTILYYLPQNDIYVMANGIILFVTCMAMIPKFKTVLRFLINNIFIIIIQFIIIWLRLDIKIIAPVFPNWMQFAVMNIDQIVILTLLYLINRKWGDIYGMVVFRRKK